VFMQEMDVKVVCISMLGTTKKPMELLQSLTSPMPEYTRLVMHVQETLNMLLIIKDSSVETDRPLLVTLLSKP